MADLENHVRTLIGDVLIGKDEDGEFGNLIVEGTIRAGKIIADTETGYNYTATIQGDGQTTFFYFDHNLDAIPPSVTMIDSQGNYVMANLKVVSKNRISSEFKNPPLIGTTYWINIRK